MRPGAGIDSVACACHSGRRTLSPTLTRHGDSDSDSSRRRRRLRPGRDWHIAGGRRGPRRRRSTAGGRRGDRDGDPGPPAGCHVGVRFSESDLNTVTIMIAAAWKSGPTVTSGRRAAAVAAAASPRPQAESWLTASRTPSRPRSHRDCCH